MKADIQAVLKSMNEPQREGLKEWLRARLEANSNVDSMEAPWWNLVACAVELGAMRKASRILRGVLNELEGFRPLGGRKEDPRDSYGVDPA